MLIFLTISFCTAAQNYSTSNKKAIKAYEEALQSFNRMDYNTAAEVMQKAIKYDDKFIGHAWYNKDDWTILNVYVATHKLNSCALPKYKKSTGGAEI